MTSRSLPDADASEVRAITAVELGASRCDPSPRLNPVFHLVGRERVNIGDLD